MEKNVNTLISDVYLKQKVNGHVCYISSVVLLIPVMSLPLALLHEAVSGWGMGEMGGNFTTLLLPDPGLDLASRDAGWGTFFVSRGSGSDGSDLVLSLLKSSGME